MKRARLVVSGLVIAVAVSGCDLFAGSSAHDRKVEQCNTMFGVINPMVEQVSKVTERKVDKDDDYAKLFDEIATMEEQTSASLGRLSLTVQQLQTYSSNYQAMARDCARAARDMATVFKTLSAPNADEKTLEALQGSAESAQARFDAVAAREDVIVDGLNAFCAAD